MPLIAALHPHPAPPQSQPLYGLTVWKNDFNRFTIDGKQLQHGSRTDLRPFNAEELRRILRVGLCLPCHKSYDHPAYKEYDVKRNCPHYQEP